MNNFTYYNPVRIEFGLNKLNILDRLIGDRRALLVTMPIFNKLGFVKQIMSTTNKIIYVNSRVSENPSFNNLSKLYKNVWQKEFNVIIALGGGSVIDSAKVLSVYNKKKDFAFVEKLVRSKIEKKDYKLIPIISIPTTAGTGSEVTPWATVWDRIEQKKYSLHLKDLWSEVALLDSNLTLSLPKNITKQTALDALSHCLESIWNKNANPISTNYAIKSAKKILITLPKVLKDPFNEKFRSELMLASLMAGLAFSNTKTAIAHALSYYISAKKGIPHGIACSFTLPDIVDSVLGQDKKIDSALLEIFGELSSEKLRIFFNQINVSTKFSNYGFDFGEFKMLEKSLVGNQRVQNSLVNNKVIFEKFYENSL